MASYFVYKTQLAHSWTRRISRKALPSRISKICRNDEEARAVCVLNSHGVCDRSRRTQTPIEIDSNIWAPGTTTYVGNTDEEVERRALGILLQELCKTRDES